MAKTHTTTANLTVKIVMNDRGNPPGKLADAELHFGDGLLAGLKLIGFAVWSVERRRPERDVSRAAVRRERRTAQLRVAATDRDVCKTPRIPSTVPADSFEVEGVTLVHPDQ